MITVVHNDVLKGIEILMDDAGADLLIKKLENLKSQGGHFHLYGTNDDRGVCMKSPYRHDLVFGELILNLLPSEAWDNLK